VGEIISQNIFSGKLLAIVGPTASGKTALSIHLAERLHGEIVSADSRQIYRHLDIGTAKPSSEELKRVPHHFVNILDPDQEYNAGIFGTQARKKIEEIFLTGRQPILVGGSGLYVRAVIDGLIEAPERNVEIRKQLEEEARTFGTEVLIEKLKKVDPVSAATIEPTRLHRIVRALEVFYTSGQPISKLHIQQNTIPSFEVCQFGLLWDRGSLYKRIEERVDMMIERGLIEEIKDIIELGYSSKANALNTVGYKEVFDFLHEKLTKEKMIDLIKQNTRHFAKRQMTWFRADQRIEWIHVDERTEWASIADIILEKFQSSN
jgi:tRNA dimethylallyltransferase